MLSLDHVVTFTLIYMLAGSLVWLFLDGLGIVENTFEARFARGQAVTLRAAALASVMMILAWPKFVFALVKARRAR